MAETKQVDSFVHHLTSGLARILEQKTGRFILYYLEGKDYPVPLDVLLAVAQCYCDATERSAVEVVVRLVQDEVIICDYDSDPNGVELFELTKFGDQCLGELREFMDQAVSLVKERSSFTDSLPAFEASLQEPGESVTNTVRSLSEGEISLLILHNI